jgi:hypothetical protein
MFFHKIVRFLKSSLNISFFLTRVDLSHAHDTAHSYCEIITHATLKATQAQGHKKEIEERNIK